jgi:mandelamide amidase
MTLYDLSATEALRGMEEGRFTSEELVESLIDRYEDTVWINALIGFSPEWARAAARAADIRRRRGKAGPLTGLPIIVKDNIDVVGFRTTCNTPALLDYEPESQGPVIQTLLEAGAFVFSKANMHELAFGPGLGKAPPGEQVIYGHFGAVLNPYDRNASTAGSSNGVAAALAARTAPVGLGTDTGGSVRNPASFCGVVAFRPSVGRYSQAGVVPISHTRDTIGPMARTVADLALIDRCISGQERPSSDSILSRLRLGAPRDFFYAGGAPEVLSVIEGELDRLRDLGVEIVEAEMPGMERLIAASGEIIAIYEVRTLLSRYLEQSGSGVTLEELVDRVATTGLADFLREILFRMVVPESSYQEALTQLRPAIQDIYRKYFADHRVDAIIFPSTLIAAPHEGETTTIVRNGVQLSEFQVVVHNATPSSIVGTPGLSIPVGMTDDGRPISIALDGPRKSDQALLEIGMAYENSRPEFPGPNL